MALRKVPIVKGEFYHIFNRTVGSEEVFLEKREIERAIKTIQFYAFEKVNIRYSYYFHLKPDAKEIFWKEILKKPSYNLDIFSFSLMSNHFHFLVRENKSKGIFYFISNF